MSSLFVMAACSRFSFFLPCCLLFWLLFSLSVSLRNLALLLGVWHPDREAGRWCRHLWYRPPHRLQHLPSAQPNMAHLQYVVIHYHDFTSHLLNAKMLMLKSHVKTDVLYVHWQIIQHICFVVISLSVIEVILFIMVIFLRMRLRIAIALLEEGSK